MAAQSSRVARRRLVLGLIALLVAACMPSPGSTPPSPAAPGTPPRADAPAATAPAAIDPPLTPPVTVNVGVVNSTSDAGIFVAQERGYFREQGIDINLAVFQGAQQQVPLLATGQLDVGGGATAAGLINAFAREIPIRIVADKGSSPPGFGYQGIVVRKDLVDSGAFQGCPSFQGMRVANAAIGNSFAQALDRALQACGLQLGDVELVEMSFPDIPAAVHRGAVDAGQLLEPGLTLALADNLVALYKRTDEVYPNQQIAVLLYGPQFIATQRPAAERFMLAYVRGVRDYWAAFTQGRDKAAILDILARNTTVKDVGLLERITPAGLNPDGYIHQQPFIEDVQWWVAHGLVSGQVDPTQMVDNSFVDYAIARLGRWSPR